MDGFARQASVADPDSTPPSSFPTPRPAVARRPDTPQRTSTGSCDPLSHALGQQALVASSLTSLHAITEVSQSGSRWISLGPISPPRRTGLANRPSRIESARLAARSTTSTPPAAATLSPPGCAPRSRRPGARRTRARPPSRPPFRQGPATRGGHRPGVRDGLPLPATSSTRYRSTRFTGGVAWRRLPSDRRGSGSPAGLKVLTRAVLTTNAVAAPQEPGSARSATRRRDHLGSPLASGAAYIAMSSRGAAARELNRGGAADRRFANARAGGHAPRRASRGLIHRRQAG